MSKLEKLKRMSRIRETKPLEWDADDPAGDESAYDGEAVSSIPYDHSQFEGGQDGN